MEQDRLMLELMNNDWGVTEACYSADSVPRKGSLGGYEGMRMEVGVGEDLVEV